MTHFGIISTTGEGHINPTTALGRELLMRGHRVTLFSIVDACSKAIDAGLDFVAIGEAEFPKGSSAQAAKRLGELDGLAALSYTLDLSKQATKLMLKDAPKAIRHAEVEALIIDQTLLEGATIAEVLKLPFVTLCNALMLDPDPNVPPPLIPWVWNYDSSWWGYICNQFGYTFLQLFGSPLKEIIEDYRRQHNLPITFNPSFDEINSPLAIISQQPREFEFPRTRLSPHFHFVGSLVNSATRTPVEFPMERLTGQPLIYASLGTIQNRKQWVFKEIAQACVGLDAQLVISLGGALKKEKLGELPGKPIVVNYAPQLELLEKASLCITHAGLNTVLESLSYGVPMVAIPIANDQPAIAARIAWTRTGEIVSLNCLSSSKLKKAIEQVLSGDSYKEKALELQKAIKQAGGVKKAADIVEKAILTKQSVYNY